MPTSLPQKTLRPEHLEHLAVFPLGGAVMFPGTALPLHIFEPRYRALTQEAVDEGIPITIVHLFNPRQRDEAGRPAFHAIGCVGFVRYHNQLPDGRSNILLEGVQRVRILEEITEHSEKPYRVVRAELFQEDDEPQAEVNTRLRTLHSMTAGFRPTHERLADTLAQALQNPPGLAADALAGLLLSDPEQRQAMLEEPRVLHRLDLLTDRLGDLLLAAHGQSGESVH